MKHQFHRTTTRCRQLLAAASMCAALGTANAANFTLSGDLTQDDQITWITLSLTTAGPVSVTSLGYGGGTDTLGHLRPGGGFDSMLFLYSATGTLLAQSDDAINAAIDPGTGLASDAGFATNLAVGTYKLALTQYDNFALGNLAAGFSQAGAGNFTPTLSPSCTASSFCDWSGAGRTGHWVLAITGVSAVPEPASLLLMLGGLAALGGLAGRKTRTT